MTIHKTCQGPKNDVDPTYAETSYRVLSTKAVGVARNRPTTRGISRLCGTCTMSSLQPEKAATAAALSSDVADRWSNLCEVNIVRVVTHDAISDAE